MSLRVKITLAFLLLGTIIAGISYFQITSLTRVGETLSQIIERDIALINAVEKIQTNVLKIESTIRQPINAQTIASMQSYRQDLSAARDAYKQQATPEQIPTEQLNQLTGSIDKILADIQGLYQTDMPLTQSQRAAMLANLIKDQDALIAHIEIAAQSLQHFTTQRQEIDDNVGRTVSIVILSAILAILLAMMLGLMVALRLSRQMNKLRVGAQHIANGNLAETITVHSKDEIGQLAESFNQMSARLRESYRRLAIESQRDVAMLQSMGEGLIAIDENSRVVLINPVAASMLELEEKMATGKILYDLFALYDQKDRPLAVQETPMHLTLHTGAASSDVFGFFRKSKQKILVSVNASPIALDGKVVGAVLILRDVTKEKEVDRMKTEFISLASHQLRTPLSAIKWFSEMLLSGDAGKLSADQEDFAHNIADSTERMIQLVNSLLNISRIESGRIMISPQPTDLKDLVSGIINDLKAKTEDKKQTLIVSVHGDMPKINVDTRLIGQVYLNLMTNAIKYTPKGGEISVFISRKGDQVISQVTDNGYGIPKEQQQRIFQKFFRAANAVKVETDGTGLGLYLIKAIVESSGGKIWFESEEGKGSTFWFTLPLSGMKPKEGEVTLDV